MLLFLKSSTFLSLVLSLEQFLGTFFNTLLHSPQEKWKIWKKKKGKLVMQEHIVQSSSWDN